MVLEASRGRACLPGLHSEFIALLKHTSECAMLVVDPEVVIGRLVLKQCVQDQEDCVLTLGNIEEQLMRHGLRRRGGGACLLILNRRFSVACASGHRLQHTRRREL